MDGNDGQGSSGLGSVPALLGDLLAGSSAGFFISLTGRTRWPCGADQARLPRSPGRSLFRDAKKGDFRLKDDSPCLGKVVDVGLPFKGKVPDVGAFSAGH
jgi:hypothetical protein